MEEGALELQSIRNWGAEAARSYQIMAYESRKAGRLAKKAGDMGAIGQGIQGVASAYSFGSSILGS
jgi:hypothetical protein